MKRLVVFVGILGLCIITSVAADMAPAHNAFGFKCVKALSKEEKGGNVFVSPTSISLALSMVYNGANGQTKEAISKALQFDGIDISVVNQSNKSLINSLKQPDQLVELTIANSLWARKDIEFKQSFMDTVADYYNAQISTLDFDKPTAAQEINSWVNNNTNGRIKGIIEPPIRPGVVMYLVNAVYFKGTWTKDFDKKLTSDGDFTTEAGVVKKHPFMRQKGKMLYMETEDFQSVSIPYGKNRRISMYVFLPKNLSGFLQSLDEMKWSEWMSQYRQMEGALALPKFKMEYEKELKALLRQMGMGIAFEDVADFSGMGKSLKISEVKHKTFVDVNEEGTEAAGATSIAIAPTSARINPKTFVMEVNRPFFFAIVDNYTYEAIFMGAIQSP